ncbi:outer dense fiber protein 2-like isoform X2 [Cololabis saira]|uniref:outer dense fiber protein 2-like isoform X2 n=1 Tax=Cololabis saira TaxID=129043 RepID=UPI002AD2226B|nr:outer dense fiber protein 2-like isoform X2 [Cololabis saira]
MKTRHAPAPAPPVHVHVPDTTPVHVHMRRSASKTPQSPTKDARVKRDGGRAKVLPPWIPPGRVSCRRSVGASIAQTENAHHQSDCGIRYQDDVEEQGEKLAGISENISVLLGEQERIRRSKRDTDELLRALVEAEIDGVAVANQLTALKETIDSFTKRESLMKSEQNDAFKKRLADNEAENIRLLAKLTNKEKEASKLAEHLEFEKDNLKTTEELSRIVESTRDHLEFQLKQAAAEKTQLAAQIQRMKQSHEQTQEELQNLQEELQTVKKQEEDEEGKPDQEMRTLLTQRAEQAEESTRQLTKKLREKESKLCEALSTSSDWCLRHSKEAAVKGQLEEEISALKLRVSELNSQLHSAEEKSRVGKEEIRNQIHQMSAENTSTKLENQRLKRELTSCEEKFSGLHSEARHFKSSIKKYENKVEKYKKKVQQARLESEEYCLKLEVVQKEARDVKVSLEREKEQVRREVLGRLRELEPLPERLKKTELQLRDAQQEADAQQRRNMENNAALSEVRHKVEQQGSQMEMFRQRNLLLQEENNVLKEKIHNLERKLEDTSIEKKEMSQALTLKEGSTCSLQQRLEEKTRECSFLSLKLQEALDDAQRQVDDGMQTLLAKERTSQTKALDLQSQLSQAKTELSQLQRSKEDMERRFQNQLQNMKERLQQSDSTNRSLQKYVHFLKTSYGNVFGDSLIAS